MEKRIEETGENWRDIVSKKAEYHMKKSLQIVIFLVCEALILAMYVIGGRWAKMQGKKDVICRRAVEVDTALLCELENVDVLDGNVVFTGWALHINSQNKGIALILNATEGEEEHVFWGTFSERRDIKEYYVPDWEFEECGFTASTSKKEFKKDMCYEILVNLSYLEKNGNTFVEANKKMATGYFYYNEKLYQYNPTEFEKPLIKDEELLQVLEDGILRMYDAKEDEWLYQYQGKAYYIVNADKNRISEETRLVVPMMPSTSRPDLLPEERKQYGGDHLGAYYADESYWREGILPYQVIVVDLPTTYPMTYLSTGLYDDSNVCWKNSHIIPFFDWREYREN